MKFLETIICSERRLIDFVLWTYIHHQNAIKVQILFTSQVLIQYVSYHNIHVWCFLGVDLRKEVEENVIAELFFITFRLVVLLLESECAQVVVSFHV